MRAKSKEGLSKKRHFLPQTRTIRRNEFYFLPLSCVCKFSSLRMCSYISRELLMLQTSQWKIFGAIGVVCTQIVKYFKMGTFFASSDTNNIPGDINSTKNVYICLPVFFFFFLKTSSAPRYLIRIVSKLYQKQPILHLNWININLALISDQISWLFDLN